MHDRRVLGVGLGLTGLLAAAPPAASLPAPTAQPLRRGPCPAAEKELNEAGARCAEVTVPSKLIQRQEYDTALASVVHDLSAAATTTSRMPGLSRSIAGSPDPSTERLPDRGVLC
ncbi:hypothetical protein [Streptomyces sp. UG1]|uniref:hypothetical protein n=1 Tax=Streptomyces sp. UG1 TaxID=3417652 RepID=UPI003CF1BB52